MSKTVLVTGGAGYIGSHTCKALAHAGYTPITYDDLSNGYKKAVKWGPLEEGDVSNRMRLIYVLERYQPQACIHFAGFIQVGESVQKPEKYYRNNVIGTMTLLDVLREKGINSVVFSSSAAIYGEPHTTPIPDDHPLNPINPYGETKRVIESVLRDYGAAYGLRSVSLRYFNAAGADPDGETGERHDPESHLIPLVLDAASGKRPSITVYGSDYDTPDGTCLRDYIHVTDLAQAHLLALQNIEDGPAARSYNLGNGRPHSVFEVIETARKVTGKEIPVEMGPRRGGDPPELVADSSRIKAELGWKPGYEELGTIIGSAWEWHKKVHKVTTVIGN